MSQTFRSAYTFIICSLMILIISSCDYEKFGQDDFIKAVKNNQIEQVKNHSKSVKILLANYNIEGQETALHIAFKSKYYELSEYLIDLGASIHVPNENGDTPIDIANKLNDEVLIRLINKTRFKQWKSVENKFDDQILLSVVEEDNPLILADFLKDKINADYIFEDSGLPILVHAAFEESPRCFNLIINSGADPNTIFDSVPAIAITAMLDEYEMTKILIDKGADINNQDGMLKTALMHAAEEGYENIVKLLLKHGADKSLTDINGENAFIKAKKNNHQKIVQLLKNKL